MSVPSVSSNSPKSPLINNPLPNEVSNTNPTQPSTEPSPHVCDPFVKLHEQLPMLAPWVTKEACTQLVANLRAKSASTTTSAESAPKPNALTVEDKIIQVDLQKDILPAIRRIWPEASENAVRIVVAHMKLELGPKLQSCHNYNFGNIKATPNEKHAFVKGTWECLLSDRAEKEVSKDPAHARIENTHPNPNCGTKKTVVFDPPHAQTRFKVYDSIDDGLRALVDRHKRYAQDPEYQKALDNADTDAIAKGLHKRHYFTATPESYAKLLKSQLPR